MDITVEGFILLLKTENKKLELKLQVNVQGAKLISVLARS